jgi:hypothetical protein
MSGSRSAARSVVDACTEIALSLSSITRDIWCDFEGIAGCVFERRPRRYAPEGSGVAFIAKIAGGVT